MEEQNGTAVDAAIATLFCNGLIGWVTFGPLESFFNPYFSNPRKKITFKSHCEKFLLRNLNVGMDVAIFLFQLVVQIQPLVFLNQVPTHLLDKHIGIVEWSVGFEKQKLGDVKHQVIALLIQILD